jgi:NAD(P)-dependent dehydrogenase (short-subunit alcohol dehydrogenase family)
MAAQAGKTAVIIGASRGLGYALAAGYLAQGWQVTATAGCNTWTTRVRPSAGSARGLPLTAWRTSP